MENKKVYTQCKKCLRWVNWIYEDIDSDWRYKRCPKCLEQKKLPIMRISFKTVDGELWQSWRGEEWEKSSEVNEIYKELI